MTTTVEGYRALSAVTDTGTVRAPPRESASGSFVLPASLEYIEEEAFEQTSAQEVYLPELMQSIGESAFSGNASLRSVYIPASVTFIAEDAFADSRGLTIYGSANSYAEEWARAHGYTFRDQTVCVPAFDPILRLLLELTALSVLFGLIRTEPNKPLIPELCVDHGWINDPKDRAALRALSLDFP